MTKNLVKPSEARVRLRAATSDGIGCAGVIEEVGSDVEIFAVGDEVLCQPSRALTRFDFEAGVVDLPQELIAKKPATLAFGEAAQLAAGLPRVEGDVARGVRLRLLVDPTSVVVDEEDGDDDGDDDGGDDLEDDDDDADGDDDETR